jgi:dTMP kinase
MRKGRFIVIDGPDGCGKSTQVNLLSKYLRQQGHKVLLVREPGSTSISEAIRKILLSPRYKKMTSLTELFLYLASRVQLVYEVIRPSLQENKIVISDRFLSSTIVYQGYAGNIGMGVVKRIWQMTMGSFCPDMTILLDVPAEKGMERIKNSRSSNDRMEQRELAFHKRVRDGFMKLACSDKRKYYIIDGTKSLLAIHTQIRKIVNNVL